MKDPLFTPFKIGILEIPNRLIRSACSERAADPEGFVTDELINLYVALAAGGAGMVVTGYAFVHPSGRCNARQTAVSDDRFIPGLTRLTEAFHRANPRGKIFLQVVHGGRQSKPYLVDEVVAPSPVLLGGVTPRPLRHREIIDMANAFASAALRAKQAGFDGVQLHGAHGFLISQFNSPFTNHREDLWGGTPENRSRFFIEIIGRARKLVGDDYPITAKVNGSDFLEEKGINLGQVIPMLQRAEETGIDGVEVSGGMADTPAEYAPVRGPIRLLSQEAYLLPWARSIKKEINGPVITVGGIRSAKVARKIITSNDADGVAMCRPFIRQPDLPLRWKEGALKSSCISCGGCSIDTGGATRCTLSEGKEN